MNINQKSKKILLSSAVALLTLTGVSSTVSAAELGNQASNTLKAYNPEFIYPEKQNEWDGELVRPRIVLDSSLSDKEKDEIREELLQADVKRKLYVKKAKVTGDWQPYYAFEYLYTPGFFHVTKVKDENGKDKYFYEKNKVYFGWLMKNHISENSAKPNETFLQKNIKFFNEAKGLVPFITNMNATPELAETYGIPQPAADFFGSKYDRTDLLRGLILQQPLIEDPTAGKIEVPPVEEVKPDPKPPVKDPTPDPKPPVVKPTPETKPPVIKPDKNTNSSFDTIDKVNPGGSQSFDTIDKVNPGGSSSNENTAPVTDPNDLIGEILTGKEDKIDKNQLIKYNLKAYFENPEQQKFKITVNGKKDTNDLVKLDGNYLTFKSSKPGVYKVSIVNSEGDERIFKITVASDIDIIKKLEDIQVSTGTSDKTLDMKDYFKIPDGGVIDFYYDYIGSKENVELKQGFPTLTLSPNVIGVTVITVKAKDTFGNETIQTFTYSVMPPKVTTTEVKGNNKLPQTGEETTGLTTAIGVGLLALASFLVLRRR